MMSEVLPSFLGNEMQYNITSQYKKKKQDFESLTKQKKNACVYNPLSFTVPRLVAVIRQL
jgi:hypothetical protein